MILILTTCDDVVADQVCEWLYFYDVLFFRINSDTVKKFEYKVDLSSSLTRIIIKVDGYEVSLNGATVIWNRRGFLAKHNEGDVRQHAIDNYDLQQTIRKHLLNEIDSLINFIYIWCKGRNIINCPLVYNYNKLWALEIAKQIGFKIPETLITTNKSDLNEFIRKVGKVITKPIQDIVSHRTYGYFVSQKTEFLDDASILNISSSFFPSCFQECIQKKYELRIFYFLSEVYAIANFSQENANSIVDGRAVERDDAKSNRLVKYILEKRQLEKINRFMNVAKLESGSIDIIVDKSGEFIFLEVNPVGQFDYLNKRANFSLEKIIAKKLIAYEKAPFERG